MGRENRDEATPDRFLPCPAPKMGMLRKAGGHIDGQKYVIGMAGQGRCPVESARPPELLTVEQESRAHLRRIPAPIT